MPVDHLHGHVVASTLGDDPIEPPFLCLVASGGHTFVARVDEPSYFTVLGRTLDDAAGEAFDKGARLLGLGYPGGPALDKLAKTGDPAAFDFPRSRPGDGLDFSFSGLKTALLYKTRDLGEEETRAAPGRPRGVLPARDRRRARAPPRAGDRARRASARIAIGGGVAANSWLREAVHGLGADRVHVPARELCTDNAAMIAGAARFLPALDYPDYLAMDATARTLAA